MTKVVKKALTAKAQRALPGLENAEDKKGNCGQKQKKKKQETRNLPFVFLLVLICEIPCLSADRVSKLVISICHS